MPCVSVRSSHHASGPSMSSTSSESDERAPKSDGSRLCLLIPLPYSSHSRMDPFLHLSRRIRRSICPFLCLSESIFRCLFWAWLENQQFGSAKNHSSLSSFLLQEAHNLKRIPIRRNKHLLIGKGVEIDWALCETFLKAWDHVLREITGTRIT